MPCNGWGWLCFFLSHLQGEDFDLDGVRESLNDFLEVDDVYKGQVAGGIEILPCTSWKQLRTSKYSYLGLWKIAFDYFINSNWSHWFGMTETATVLLSSFENNDFLTRGWQLKGSCNDTTCVEVSKIWSFHQDEEDGHHPAPYTRCCGLGVCFEKLRGIQENWNYPWDIGGWGGERNFWKLTKIPWWTHKNTNTIDYFGARGSFDLFVEKVKHQQEIVSLCQKQTENINKSW